MIREEIREGRTYNCRWFCRSTESSGISGKHFTIGTTFAELDPQDPELNYLMYLRQLIKKGRNFQRKMYASRVEINIKY